jgi:hypothetical protein
LKATILILAVWAMALAVRAEIPIVIRGISSIEPVSRTSLDQSEPDTISYDDRGTNYMIGSVSNYYVFTRFTVPSDFQLRSIYVGIRDDIGSAQPCSVWVHSANGSMPGEELGQAAINVTTGVRFYDVTLPEPIDFLANEDFFVVVGRSPGVTAGWSPVVDANSSSGRSSITLNSRVNGPWQVLPVDVRIRVGGTLTPYIDLCAEECFNDVNGHGPSFYLLPGDSVQFKGIVTNLSDQNAASFSALWTVTDAEGVVHFQSERVQTGLDAGAQAILSAPQVFISDSNLSYTVRFNILYPDDADTTNNSSMLRMWMGKLPAWYGYNDMILSAAGNHDLGWISGVSFKPVQYPAMIDCVLIACGSASTTVVRIYRNDDTGRPAGFPVWSATENMNFNFNMLPVTPPVRIDSGGSFTVAFVYGTNSTLIFDATSPCVSNITSMGTFAWLYGPTGWQPDRGSNFIMRVHLDTAASSAARKYPTGNYLVDRMELLQNYPNPFNSRTEIQFKLSQETKVILRIYDLNGREIQKLAEGVFPAGSHSVSFDGTGLSSGVYFCQIESGAQRQVRKLMLLK